MPCFGGTLTLRPLGNFRATANRPSNTIWAWGSWPAIIAAMSMPLPSAEELVVPVLDLTTMPSQAAVT